MEELAQLHDSIGRWMEANAPYIARVDRIEDALKGEPPIQMMLCGSVERMRRAETRLLQLEGVSAVGDSKSSCLVSLNRTEYPDRDLSILDILPGGCSKGAALLRVASARGVRPQEIMAIGDNWNDLSMFEVAGHAVVMGDAPLDMLELARGRGWTIGEPHDQDGVAQAIEEALTVGAALTGGPTRESKGL